MAIDITEATAGFQFCEYFFQWCVVDLNLATTIATDQMVVVVLPGNLIDEMATAYVGGMGKPIFGQELERAIDGGLCQPGGGRFCARKYLGWRKMRAFMMQHMQNRHPLRRHAESAGS